MVAGHVRRLWPGAIATTAGGAGADVLGTGNVLIEVKARRSLDLPAWLRQATGRTGDGQVPVLVVRGDGQGPATAGQWAAVMPLDVLLDLLEQAGYGR